MRCCPTIEVGSVMVFWRRLSGWQKPTHKSVTRLQAPKSKDSSVSKERLAIPNAAENEPSFTGIPFWDLSFQQGWVVTVTTAQRQQRPWGRGERKGLHAPHPQCSAARGRTSLFKDPNNVREGVGVQDTTDRSQLRSTEADWTGRATNLYQDNGRSSSHIAS